MKKEVFGLSDLQEVSSFFKTSPGAWLGRKLIKWLDVEKVNQVHAAHCNLRGADFTTAILNDPLIDVKYKVHREEILDTLPEGAFLTISNHPIGSIDGIMLIDIFARRRPDFKVMVNGILTKIGAMDDNFISVHPDSKNLGANMKNINGVRLSLEHLKGGHPMGFFPAGAISMYNKETKKIQDLPWTHSVIRLIRKSKLPVYPVYFDFLNSNFFYTLARIDWRIRTLRIAKEAFNKRGRTVDVFLGDPIPAAEIQSFKNDDELADFLYKRTYGSKK